MLLSTKALLAPNNLFSIKKYIVLKKLLFKNDRGTIQNLINFLFLIPFFRVEIKVLLICIHIDHGEALLLNAYLSTQLIGQLVNQSLSEVILIYKLV